MDLVNRSIEIILQGQSATGAYIASPNFNTYQYSWFRDGSFIAFAMDLFDEKGSASRFHQWVFDTLNQNRFVMKHTVEKRQQQLELEPKDYLHTRYTLDGMKASEDWPNHQLDGFGTWLWSLAMHQQKINEALTETQKRIVEDLADYLVALWNLPCYDCWEEFPDYLHLYTLASIYAGLQACQQLTGKSYVGAMEEIKQYIEQNGSPKGYFVKSVGMTSVDSSLIGLCLPYELVGPDDPRMTATISKIKADLYNGRGLKRYKEDTYYGGGDWVLLAAWLGWYDARIGQRKEAISLRDWIESIADESGQLPEQVPFALNAPSQYEYWVNRWGEIARPLLWSHAMYLILVNELAKSA